MEESLPPGFRFHPTDEELITYYLTRKVTEFGFATRAIADVDLNKCEPWDLPGKASMGEKEWYFFSMRDRKYPTGLRTNRATDAGYWKTTGKDKEIFHCGMLVGMKKTLVFYRGRAPKGEKTSWVMHEYRLQNKFAYRPTKEEWVVCRVFKKCSTGKRPSQGTPTLCASLDSPCNTASLGELGEIDVSLLSNFAATASNTSSSSSALQGGGEHFGSGKVDMGAYMSWVAASQGAAAVLPWAPGLFGSVFSANPAILKALPLGGYQPRELGSAANLGDTAFGTEAKGMECEEQSQPPPPLPQQIDQESIWRSY